MIINIILRSILISFLVAIPAPFLLDWLGGMNEANSGVSTFAGIYLLAFVGCIIMGLTRSSTIKVKRNAAVSCEGPALQTEGREEGIVKWFNVTKGFGFITRESGDDVFVHYRSVRGNGRRTLREGQSVTFVVVDGDKGLQADDVSADD